MHINFIEVIYAVINFILLVVLLRLFLYKPVHKMLATRRQTISESLAAAEQAKQQAADADEKIRAQVKQAKAEAEGILATARASGDELKKQLLTEAREEARAITEKARAALNKEREETITNLRKETARLAVSVAGRILAEEMSAEQQQALLHKYIMKVGQLQ